MDASHLNSSKPVRAEQKHHPTASTSATGPVNPVPQSSVHVLIIPVIQAMSFLYMYKKLLQLNTSCLRAEACSAASEAQWSVTCCPKPLLPIYFFPFFCSQCRPMHSHIHSTPQHYLWSTSGCCRKPRLHKAPGCPPLLPCPKGNALLLHSHAEARLPIESLQQQEAASWWSYLYQVCSIASSTWTFIWVHPLAHYCLLSQGAPFRKHTGTNL